MAVKDASSDDNFDGVSDQTVTVTTTDNDTAAFTLGAISGTVTEAASTATFTVVLDLSLIHISEPTRLLSMSGAGRGW